MPLPAVEYLHPAAESYRTIFASLQAGVAYTLTFSARSATGGWLIVYTATNFSNLYQQTPPLTAGYTQYAYTFTSTVGQALMAYFATDDIDMISIRLARMTDGVVFTRAPLRPSFFLATPQALPESAGAVRYGHDFYDADDEFDLPLRLTTAELAAFVTFWRTVARGMVNPLVYTDVRGSVLPVRFAAPALPQIVETAYNLHTTTIRLRVQ